MKTRNYLSLVLVLLMFNACNKPKVVTKEVKFTSTTYDNLSSYNSQGIPDILLKDTIPTDLLNFIDTLLPDGKNLTIRHPELFSSSAIGDITITSPSTVYITFVNQSGAYNNAIAFYTYPTNQPPTKPTDISKITYVFPNAGGHTALQPGDKANIGNFTAGTSIGFVLMENAWDTTN